MRKFKVGDKAVTNCDIENVTGVLPSGSSGVVSDKASGDLLFFTAEGSTNEWAVFADELDKQED